MYLKKSICSALVALPPHATSLVAENGGRDPISEYCGDTPLGTRSDLARGKHQKGELDEERPPVCRNSPGGPKWRDHAVNNMASLGPIVNLFLTVFSDSRTQNQIFNPCSADHLHHGPWYPMGGPQGVLALIT